MLPPAVHAHVPLFDVYSTCAHISCILREFLFDCDILYSCLVWDIFIYTDFLLLFHSTFVSLWSLVWTEFTHTHTLWGNQCILSSHWGLQQPNSQPCSTVTSVCVRNRALHSGGFVALCFPLLVKVGNTSRLFIQPCTPPHHSLSHSLSLYHHLPLIQCHCSNQQKYRERGRSSSGLVNRK